MSSVMGGNKCEVSDVRSHVGYVMCQVSGAHKGCCVSCDVRSRGCEA